MADLPEGAPEPKLGDPADKSGVDQFQQVNRRAGYGNKWEMTYRFAKNGASLAAGEGALLVARIEELEAQLSEKFIDGLYLGRLAHIILDVEDGLPFDRDALVRQASKWRSMRNDP